MRRGVASFCLGLLGCPPLPGGGGVEGAAEMSTSGTSSGATLEEPDPFEVPCRYNHDCPDRCFKGVCVSRCGPEVPCSGGLVCVEDACVPSIDVPSPCGVSVGVTRVREIELPGGKPPTKVGAVDIDGDGAPELLAERGGLWLIRLDGAAPAEIPGQWMEGPLETNVGDIDGDGFADLVPRAGDIVLFGDGAGNFTEAPGPDVALIDGALGDLDGDGRAEMVGFLHGCLHTSPEAECATIAPAAWLRHADGWERGMYGTHLGAPGNMLVAPLGRDFLPVAVFESASQSLIVLMWLADKVADVTLLRVSLRDSLEYSSLVVARRQGDDRAELVRVVARQNGWTWGARIRAFDPGLDYLEVPDRWALKGAYRRVTAGDIDLDGNDDLVLAGAEEILLLLDREEQAAGVCVVAVPVADGGGAIALADLDGAGAPELIVTTEAGLAVFALSLSP